MAVSYDSVAGWLLAMLKGYIKWLQWCCWSPWWERLSIKRLQIKYNILYELSTLTQHMSRTPYQPNIMSPKVPNNTTSTQFTSPDRWPTSDDNDDDSILTITSPDRWPALVSSAETRFHAHKFNSIICVIRLRRRSVNKTCISHVVERRSTNFHISTSVRQRWLATRHHLSCANVLYMIWIRRPVFPYRCWRRRVAVDEGVLYLWLRPRFHLLWLLFLALSLLEILTRHNTRW